MYKSKKTSKQTLSNWFDELKEKPSRIVRFELVELDELYSYIHDELMSHLSFVDGMWSANPDKSVEWGFNLSINGNTYYSLVDWKKFVYDKIIELRNESNGHLDVNSLKEPPYPFIKNEHYQYTLEYKKHIVVPYNDCSYLFQRLKEEKYIMPIRHLDFMKWLFNNNFINGTDYDKFIEKGNFYSLDKSESVQRINNFNVVFNL